MLEMFITIIPEELGWAFVGSIITLCIIIGYLDFKIIREMVKDKLNHDIEDDDIN